MAIRHTGRCRILFAMTTSRRFFWFHLVPKGGVPDIHYSGWRRESRGLTSGMTLIPLSITGTMITVIVLSHRLCYTSSFMPAYPRHEIVADDRVGLYHCIVRCVRRAFLCGEDPVSGKNYDHSKEGIRLG